MRLQFITCKVMQREAYYCAARSKNVVDVVLMEQGLHDEPDRLRTEVQKALSASQHLLSDQTQYKAIGVNQVWESLGLAIATRAGHVTRRATGKRLLQAGPSPTPAPPTPDIQSFFPDDAAPAGKVSLFLDPLLKTITQL